MHLACLMLLGCQILSRSAALRCAHTCAFGPVTMGTSDPIKTPCNTRDVNTTQSVCSVLLTVNFQTSFIRGSLVDKPRSTDQSSSLSLSFTIMPAITLLSIDYRCATTDDCDQDFVRETIGSTQWLQLNETKLRADVSSLLFRTNVSTADVSCANRVTCPSTAYCRAKLTHNSSVDQMEFRNDFPCDDTSSVQVTFKQHFYTSETIHDDTLETNCDKNQCNERSTIGQVYEILRKDFPLPLNYSTYLNPSSDSSRLTRSSLLIAFVSLIHRLY